MDRMAFRNAGGFVNGFAQRGVGVDGGVDVVLGQLGGDGEAHLGDQFGGLVTDDVRSDDFAVRLPVDQFHKAIGFTDCGGLAAGHEGEDPDLVFQAFFLGGAFCQADTGDLRMAVGAAGEGGDFFRLLAFVETFDALDRLVAGDVGEPRRPDDVAGSINVLEAGLIIGIRGDVTAVRQLRLLAAGEDGFHADRDQGDASAEDLGLAVRALDRDFHAAAGVLGGGDLGGGQDGHAGFFQ